MSAHKGIAVTPDPAPFTAYRLVAQAFGEDMVIYPERATVAEARADVTPEVESRSSLWIDGCIPNVGADPDWIELDLDGERSDPDDWWSCNVPTGRRAAEWER